MRIRHQQGGDWLIARARRELIKAVELKDKTDTTADTITDTMEAFGMSGE